MLIWDTNQVKNLSNQTTIYHQKAHKGLDQYIDSRRILKALKPKIQAIQILIRMEKSHMVVLKCCVFTTLVIASSSQKPIFNFFNIVN